MQRLDALGEPGAAGMPQADHGNAGIDGGVDGVDDVLAALHAHRAAHDGGVGAVGHGAHAVHLADRGEHAGLVTRVQGQNGAGIEETLEPTHRIAGIGRGFRLKRGSHDCHRVFSSIKSVCRHSGCVSRNTGGVEPWCSADPTGDR
ncbi:Uncharacterised protein [Mycobacteroides abscessus subsp. abscessus]|nr:Uncharacterised protein [Mycobacteroides abscessus subsp. abscessus]